MAQRKFNRNTCSRRYRSAVAIGAIVLLAAAASGAGEITCSATTTRSSVPRGGEVVLRVTAEGEVGWSVEFGLPDLPGVRVYNGGTNQSMTMVNGKTRTSVSRTWYLRIERDEDFTIGPVTVEARGETCRTEPLDIAVLPPAAASPDDTGNRQAAPPREAPRQNSRTSDEIFVTLEADKDEAWIGEQVILSFRYWRRVQPWNNPSYEAPRTEGFWREELGPERTYRKVLDGRVYNVTEIRYALFPAQTGDLVIEPASLSFPEDVFDRFFSQRRRSRGPRTLRTDPVTVRVRQLPKPAPAGYSGLVANELELTAVVDRDTVPQGEPVGLAVELRTDGFLKGFSGLTVRAPDRARLHDAAESFDTALNDDRLRGTLAMEKVVVPEAAGTLQVPPVELVWFDADAGRFRTARAVPGLVEVTPGAAGSGGARDVSGFLRSEIARLDDDLAFIHPVPRRLRTGDHAFTASPLWWALLLAPAVLLGIWRLVLVRLYAERHHPHLRRRRRALANARMLLREAVGRDVDGPGLLVRAVGGFVADSEGRPLASVGLVEVEDFCRRAGREDLGRELVAVMERCEAARYGGAGDARELAALPERVETWLEELSRSRRRGGAGSAAPLVVFLALGIAAAGASLAQTGVAPEQLAAEGNQAYTEGDLERALNRYQAARDAGVDDPVLHYNLGNVHARRGELGLALANYERARRLAPRDQDIAANTIRVRRQLRDLELAGDDMPLFIGQIVDTVRRLTLDQWGMLTLVLTWCLASAVALAWSRERFGDLLRRVTLLLVAAVLGAAAVTGWRWHGEQVVDLAMVAVPEATVHSGPAVSFPTIFQVHDGLPVILRGEREGWVRITLGGDWQGWLPAESVVPVRLEPPVIQSPGR